jgi:hypothetical protein
MAFKVATRKRAKARIAIDGPAGSGKTFTALKLGLRLAGPNGKVALLDTERGSASKYSGGKPFHFDTDEPKSFSPRDYITAIQEAGAAGYDVLIIDSLSHAWAGAGGALEIVDSHKDKFGGGWRAVTPMHNALVDAILTAPLHVIVTMRSKMEYVIDEKTKKISKVGLKPVQREGMEYEFDVVMDMNDLHVGTISKSRCSEIADRSYPTPGDDLADALRAWLDEGEEAPPPVAVPPPLSAAEVAEASAAAIAATEVGAREALEDDAIRQAFEDAGDAVAIAVVVARVAALHLDKQNPRRARLFSLYTAATKRVSTNGAGAAA